ncbi:uncharacterized protein VP01_11806g1, partial [Puccinia sorghi]
EKLLLPLHDVLCVMKLSGDMEYPLVLMLLEIQKPAKHHLSQWANCIALSIQLTAQDLSFKPPSLGNLTNNNLGSYLLILAYLSSCKTTTGSNKEEGKKPTPPKVKRWLLKRRSWISIVHAITTHPSAFTLCNGQG